MSAHIPVHMPAHMSLRISVQLSVHIPVHISAHISAHARAELCTCLDISVHIPTPRSIQDGVPEPFSTTDTVTVEIRANDRDGGNVPANICTQPDGGYTCAYTHVYIYVHVYTHCQRRVSRSLLRTLAHPLPPARMPARLRARPLACSLCMRVRTHAHIHAHTHAGTRCPMSRVGRRSTLCVRAIYTRTQKGPLKRIDICIDMHGDMSSNTCIGMFMDMCRASQGKMGLH